MTKSNILQLFSELLIRKYPSAATRKTYYSCAKKFIYLNHPDTIKKLTEGYLLKFLTRTKESCSISAYNQHLSVLKLMYNTLLEQNKLKSESPIKQYPKLKNLPNWDDVNFKIKNIANIKHKALLLTLLKTGIRMNELLSIKLDDVNSSKIVINNGKGGRSGFAIMTSDLLIALRQYYSLYKPKCYLFEGVNGKYSASSVNKLVKKHIGKNYSAHWLRAIGVTHLINNNIPLHKTKLFSRHKSDSSVSWYYHYSDAAYDEIKEIMELVI